MTDPKATAMVLGEDTVVRALKDLKMKIGNRISYQDSCVLDYAIGGVSTLQSDLAASRQQAEDSCVREKAMRSEADQAQAGRIEWFNKHNALLDRVLALESNQRTEGTVESCDLCGKTSHYWPFCSDDECLVRCAAAARGDG